MVNFMLAIEIFNRGYKSQAQKKREEMERIHKCPRFDTSNITNELAHTLYGEASRLYNEHIEELINLDGLDLSPISDLN